MDYKLVTADDWQGLYINDRLIMEGHSLSAQDILNAMYTYFEDYETLNLYEIDQSYMEEIGNLPNDFNNIDKDCLNEDY